MSNPDKKKIIQLAVQGPRGMNRGTAKAILGRLSRNDPGRKTSAAAQRKFLEELLEQEEPKAKGAYPHPRETVRRGGSKEAKKDALLPSDLAWLNRLPKDPADVAFEDAGALHWLAVSLNSGHASESDKRLVRSFYEPVKRYHDRREAEHNVELARRPMGTITESARSALVELLLEEDPTIDPEWVRTLASRELDAAYAVEEQARDRAVAGAERRLGGVDNGQSNDGDEDGRE